tara:strand:+ start:7216 stop:8235 length:1020 start_codon:yes stop_codon:yes gene_type:complete
MKINYSNNLSQIVLVDGLTRSGKSSLCQMIVSLKKSEHIDMSDIFECIMSGIVLKKIKLEFAKPFLKNFFNQSAYYKMISRGVNFRPTDFTGIKNFRNPKVYINRLKVFSFRKKQYHYKKTHIKTASFNDHILEDLEKKKQFFPYQSHLILCDFDQFIKLNLNFKILEIFRSPVDNVISLINRDVFFKTSVKQDPRRFDLDIIHKKKSIPWYTYNYANEFVKANTAEKSALFVINQIKKIKNKKKIIKPYINKKILIIKFEDLVTETRKELIKIAKFLNTSLTVSTNKFMKAANCPRNIDINLKKKNIEILKKKIKNKKILDRLLSLEKDYQSNLYNFR